MMTKWLFAALFGMMVVAPGGPALALTASAAGSKADYDAAVKQADADYKAASAKWAA